MQTLEGEWVATGPCARCEHHHPQRMATIKPYDLGAGEDTKIASEKFD